MDSTLDGAQGGKPGPKRSLPVGTFVQATRGRVLEARIDPRLLSRWGTHATLAGLGVIAILVMRTSGPGRLAGQGTAPAAPGTGIARQVSARGSSGFLVREAVPVTHRSDGNSAPEASVAAAGLSVATASTAAPAATQAAPQIRTYTVQPGDTVLAVAQRFGITPETILSANPALSGNPDLLQLGQELKILPVSGVLHTVAAGDTLNSVAKRYQVDPQAIINYAANNLSAPYVLHPGDTLVVPGGAYLAPANAGLGAGGAQSSVSAQATGSFMWPVRGVITQYPWAQHVAVDIGAPLGRPIVAADAGVVLEAGWTNVGYGNYVIISHGNGFRTLYGHMSKILVTRGQKVAKGQQIGLVGSTGHSTGPHLHFEIYKNGAITNPLPYLP